MKRFIMSILLVLFLLPGLSLAEEKKGTVVKYDEGSRMLTVKGRDWEATAKVRSSDADKKDLLKEGAKVTVELDDRGGGDVRVKTIAPR